VTFAYLTDVYVLAPYRKLGLGSWMLECINDELNSWPYLRRVLLMSFLADSEKLYAEKLGMTLFEQGADGMGVLSRRGPGSTMQV
jgi:GNAT superfamily N-acetyltransferase